MEQVFSFLLLPGFSMLGFSAAVDPMRSANRLTGRPLYAWRLLSRDGRPVMASNGIEVMVHGGMADVERAPTLIVVAALQPHLYAEKATLAWLRRLDRRGCRIGAISTGTYILARAGLLDGYRCTIHWENLAALREAFPRLEITPEVYEIDRGRLTCSGGTAALDLMLALIAIDHGRELATAVAEQFIHERIRDSRDHQRMALRSRLGTSHPKLLAVVDTMERNLEEPLPRAALAARVSLSPRQLERLFRKHLNRTPTRYYLDLRLERARSLLMQTDMSVLDIALACGFVSASHFSKCYRECFNCTPRQDRAPVN